MANINYIPYAQQAADIDRQRRYAELLQQQAIDPLESQQVSGIVVPTSPLLGLTKMLQAGLGGYFAGKANKAETELKKQSQAEAKDYFAKLADYAQKGEKTGETPITTEISGYGATEPLPVLNVEDGKFSQAVKDVYAKPTKAGMLARMMEGMTSENPEMAKYASTFGTALMPSEAKYGTPFESGGKMYAMTEQGDIKDLGLSGSTKTANLQRDKRTFIGKGGVEYTQDVVFDPTTGTSKEAGEAYISKAAPTSEGSLWTKKWIDPATGQEISQQMRDQKPVSDTWVSDVAEPGFVSEKGVRKLTPTEQSKFREEDYNIDTAYGNISNLENVLNDVPWESSMAGADSGKVSSAYNSAFGAVREIAKSGVLNVSEIPFLERGLDNPQAFTNLNPVGRRKIHAQITQLKEALERKRAALYKNYQQEMPVDTNAKPTSKTQETQYDQYYSGFPQVQ